MLLVMFVVVCWFCLRAGTVLCELISALRELVSALREIISALCELVCALHELICALYELMSALLQLISALHELMSALRELRDWSLRGADLVEQISTSCLGGFRGAGACTQRISTSRFVEAV